MDAHARYLGDSGNGESGGRRRNHVFGIPSGLSRVPVTLRGQDGSASKVDLLGGFCGVGQNPRDNGLFPIISWPVSQP